MKHRGDTGRAFFKTVLVDGFIKILNKISWNFLKVPKVISLYTKLVALLTSCLIAKFDQPKDNFPHNIKQNRMIFVCGYKINALYLIRL